MQARLTPGARRLAKRKMRKPQARIRLIILATKASPSPLLGQALGQYGINIMDFCKIFNEKTKNIKEDVFIPTKINIFSRTNFHVEIKIPTTTYLLKKTCNLDTKGKQSSGTKKTVVLTERYLNVKEIYQIALFKQSDPRMSSLSLKAICKTLIGSAKSIGIKISSACENI
jgi:large subunit ribosomal protein L11